MFSYHSFDNNSMSYYFDSFLHFLELNFIQIEYRKNQWFYKRLTRSNNIYVLCDNMMLLLKNYIDIFNYSDCIRNNHSLFLYHCKQRCKNNERFENDNHILMCSSGHVNLKYMIKTSYVGLSVEKNNFNISRRTNIDPIIGKNNENKIGSLLNQFFVRIRNENEDGDRIKLEIQCIFGSLIYSEEKRIVVFSGGKNKYLILELLEFILGSYIEYEFETNDDSMSLPRIQVCYRKLVDDDVIEKLNENLRYNRIICCDHYDFGWYKNVSVIEFNDLKINENFKENLRKDSEISKVFTYLLFCTRIYYKYGIV